MLHTHEVIGSSPIAPTLPTADDTAVCSHNRRSKCTRGTKSVENDSMCVSVHSWLLRRSSNFSRVVSKEPIAGNVVVELSSLDFGFGGETWAED
jgi:hypothetical protein